eukprot:1150285-Pelagomonas_calceolata.AAC.1
MTEAKTKQWQRSGAAKHSVAAPSTTTAAVISEATMARSSHGVMLHGTKQPWNEAIMDFTIIELAT